MTEQQKAAWDAMVAALEAVVEDYDQTYDGDPIVVISIETFRKVEAALAKAKKP